MSHETAHTAGSVHLLRAEKLLQQRELAAAIELFLHAEREGAEPDRCASGRWMGQMLAGHYSQAWRESDAIRARDNPDPHRFWNGEPIRGKRLIVRCLHGLGDAVQMLRYLPRLQEEAASVVVEVPPRLLPLAYLFQGATRVITWGVETPQEVPEWDMQVEVMELPYLFRTEQSQLPVAKKYLQVPEQAAVVRQKMGKQSIPRVGVVWSASDWDPTRCLPMECLARILAIPGVEFWNLQGGAPHTAAKSEPTLAGSRDAAQFGDGLVPLAATIANMDLVITVDTLAAHLTGAMGKPAWVLLQHRADWRWMHGRDDSPWYPTLRLWRQARQDDWVDLALQVSAILREWSCQ